MRADINDRGNIVLIPDTDAERFVLNGWTKQRIRVLSYGWENVGTGNSRFSSMLIGPADEKWVDSEPVK